MEKWNILAIEVRERGEEGKGGRCERGKGGGASRAGFKGLKNPTFRHQVTNFAYDDFKFVTFKVP